MPTHDTSPQAPAGAQTLDRGLRVLWHLAKQPSGATLVELSRSLGINRTALHRLLETFVAHDFVRRDDEKRFRLAYGLVELAAAVEVDLHALAQPVMAELAEQTGSTVHLMVPISDDAVQAVLVVEPRFAAVHLAFRTGQRHPITRGSGGLAILAGRPAGPDDAPEVVEARERGYAVTHEHVIPGITGISVAVPTPPTVTEASIGISLVDPKAEPEMAPLVVAAAQELGARLRPRVPPRT